MPPFCCCRCWWWCPSVNRLDKDVNFLCTICWTHSKYKTQLALRYHVRVYPVATTEVRPSPPPPLFFFRPRIFKHQTELWTFRSLLKKKGRGWRSTLARTAHGCTLTNTRTHARAHTHTHTHTATRGWKSPVWSDGRSGTTITLDGGPAAAACSVSPESWHWSSRLVRWP